MYVWSQVTLNLTFSEAARGTSKDVEVNVVDTCQKCFGSKCELGTKAAACQYCQGTGMETITKGPFIVRSTCRYCNGNKIWIKYPCQECDGIGRNVR